MPRTAAADAMYRFDESFRDAIVCGFARFARQPVDDRGALKHAAVCIALVPEEEGERGTFFLTRRAPQLRSHAGQWALPGGRVDKGESAVDAALREMDEELGLRVAPDQVLGVLDDYATRSGFVITPVVVWAGSVRELALNPQEVTAVHRVPIEHVAAPRAVDFVRIPESDRPIIRLQLEGDYIHAPTAAILYQFVELLAGRCTRVSGFDQPVFAWR